MILVQAGNYTWLRKHWNVHGHSDRKKIEEKENRLWAFKSKQRAKMRKYEVKSMVSLINRYLNRVKFKEVSWQFIEQPLTEFKFPESDISEEETLADQLNVLKTAVDFHLSNE
jgi:hypothetical protein